MGLGVAYASSRSSRRPSRRPCQRSQLFSAASQAPSRLLDRAILKLFSRLAVLLRSIPKPGQIGLDGISRE